MAAITDAAAFAELAQLAAAMKRQDGACAGSGKTLMLGEQSCAVPRRINSRHGSPLFGCVTASPAMTIAANNAGSATMRNSRLQPKLAEMR